MALAFKGGFAVKSAQWNKMFQEYQTTQEFVIFRSWATSSQAIPRLCDSDSHRTDWCFNSDYQIINHINGITAIVASISEKANQELKNYMGI